MPQSYSVKVGCNPCKKPMFGRIHLQADTPPKRGDSVRKVKCPVCKKAVSILNVF